ncbi:MAG: 2,3-bisphosphoglycerate-independent phosphoglycerate mutase [bacterium]|nr:2,3-bisphosphoglycerate-independent phosphoglycerate mutase [bacterium]
MATSKKPVVLIVLDGYGVGPKSRGNAIDIAKTPNINLIEKTYPFTTLQASGIAVGLPWGEAGNSEVGHLTMGAGRALYHHLPRIIFSIHDGSFYQNSAFLKAAEHVKQNNSNLHIMGLTSSGSVHSYIDHLYALLEFVTRENIPKTYLHLITDGKDAPPQEGGKFISAINERIEKLYPKVKIASLIGRFYAMDRDEKWDRIKTAYELLVNGKGTPISDIGQYFKDSYSRGITDQFIEPAYIEENGAPMGRINNNDALIIFDFREDSMREISETFVKPGFDLFPKEALQKFLLVTMTEYEKTIPAIPAFPPLEINWPLGRVISEAGKNQLHIAETEKYAHVTYFFNGGQEKPFVGEDRILVQSVAVPHFDDKPEMRADEIKNRILENLGKYDFILANFANADMVGHTGNFEAIVKAIEILDGVIGELIPSILKMDGVCIITADHGNAEQKVNPITGEAVTEHTPNPVPFYLVGGQFKLEKEKNLTNIENEKQKTEGIISDIAPTILELMKLNKPDEMSGKSLLGILRK